MGGRGIYIRAPEYGEGINICEEQALGRGRESFDQGKILYFFSLSRDL